VRGEGKKGFYGCGGDYLKMGVQSWGREGRLFPTPVQERKTISRGGRKALPSTQKVDLVKKTTCRGGVDKT